MAADLCDSAVPDQQVRALELPLGPLCPDRRTLDEYDLALQHLDQLLKNPSYMSINWVHADPLFDPLRDDERLQQLLEEGEYPTLLDEFIDGPDVLGGSVRDRLRERRAAESDQ